jgi:hypothetical protein
MSIIRGRILKNYRQHHAELFDDDEDGTIDEILENDRRRARKGDEGRNTKTAYFFEDDEDHNTPVHLLGAQRYPPTRPSIIIHEPMVGDRSMMNAPFTSSKPPVLKPPSRPKPQPKPAAKAVPHELPEGVWPWPLVRGRQKDLVGDIKPSVLPTRVIPQIPQLEDAPVSEDDVEPEPVTYEQYGEVSEPVAEPSDTSQHPNLVNAPPRPDSPQPAEETEMEIAPINVTSGKRRRNFSDDEPDLVQEGEVKIRKTHQEPRIVVDLMRFIHGDGENPFPEGNFWEVPEGNPDNKIEVVKLADISHKPNEETKEETK